MAPWPLQSCAPPRRRGEVRSSEALRPGDPAATTLAVRATRGWSGRQPARTPGTSTFLHTYDVSSTRNTNCGFVLTSSIYDASLSYLTDDRVNRRSNRCAIGTAKIGQQETPDQIFHQPIRPRRLQILRLYGHRASQPAMELP